MRNLLATPLLAAVALLGFACTYERDKNLGQPATRASDAALKDPYGKWTEFDPNMRDISGGGTANFNEDAFKRDRDRTLLLK